MHPMDEFINRNKDYQKVKDIPKELIKKYRNIAPEELIYIWETLGFGIPKNVQKVLSQVNESGNVTMYKINPDGSKGGLWL